ncbi:type II secretion system protein [Photobacterium rosenbergii]|uniref:Type II secretion system protein n=1 Tax=Photobacterium rosenbergii TaxID=294936 RepID=A0ABU3ZLM7_9GAMM|nr:type II secretion system protein [Photobacterium rosenbergii]MDV5170946.1 type II secretion system protein [Photobacterium rosenbergii]
MKRQGGFTLIEMVVVIVILGILAVTAAPRFLNLQGDARASTMEGLKGAINGATGIVYGKAAVEGKEQLDGRDEDVSDAVVDNIKISFGYPQADADGLTASLKLDLASDNNKGEWRVAYDADDAPYKAAYTLAAISLPSGDSPFEQIQATECYVEYTEAVSGTEAEVKVINTGC